MEAPPGIEPGMEVLQTSALPLGDGADQELSRRILSRVADLKVRATYLMGATLRAKVGLPSEARLRRRRAKDGAGNGIRTRDFDLGKVALYH